jgi:hypothetical protein
LLNDFERVRDAAGPKGSPDLIDLTLDRAGDHKHTLPWCDCGLSETDDRKIKVSVAQAVKGVSKGVTRWEGAPVGWRQQSGSGVSPLAARMQRRDAAATLLPTCD